MTDDQADLVAERDALRERSTELEQRLRHLELTQVDHVIGLQAQLQTALGTAAALRARVSEAKAESSRLRALVKEARARIKTLEATNKKLASELSTVKSSRAFRIARRLSGSSGR